MREFQYFEQENDPPPLIQPTQLQEFFTISPEPNGKLHKLTPENFTISPEKMEKRTYQMTQTQTHQC